MRLWRLRRRQFAMLQQLLLECGIGAPASEAAEDSSEPVAAAHRALVFCQSKQMLDLIETDSPMMKGMCGHPTQRIQQALRREKEGEGVNMNIVRASVNLLNHIF